MGEKKVRICDGCGKQQDYFGTTDWVVLKIERPVFEGQQATTSQDLCDVCNEKLQLFLNRLI